MTLKGDESLRGKHRKYLPYVFTEQGIAMLSAVQRSQIAIEVSIKIMNAFVQMRHTLLQYNGIVQRLEKVEREQLQMSGQFAEVLSALENKQEKNQGIFFEGQIFDAYYFIAQRVKQAKESIILIDNYIDESILTLFSKRNENVSVTIYTKTISKSLKLDLEKYNSQYPTINIKSFNLSHDRFLIIDRKELYHIGASLKDLGKKWFAFSKMDLAHSRILEQLEISDKTP